MERIEIIAYPNQIDEIDQVLNEFQVPYIRTNAESYGIKCYCYTVTVPSKLSKTIVEAVASKMDTKQKTNIITHYKAESTISEYLDNYEKFLDETNTRKGGSKNLHNCWNRLKQIILGKKDVENRSDDDNQKRADADPLISNSSSSNLNPILGLNRDKVIIHEIGPTEELVSKTHFFIHRRKDVYAMTLLATVIALVGLISNNIAVIIGAMLIAPFMGPISSIALSSILGKQKEINDSLLFGAELIISSILLASLITFILSLLIPVEVTPEIQARTEDRAFAIIVALLLGMAGGLSLVTAIPEIIVGVAIAVALIPPAAVVGIGLGLGAPQIMIGAALVTISNIIGLILGFLIIFMLKGVSPVKRGEKIKARRLIAKNMTILIGLAMSLGAVIIYFP